MSTHWEGLDKAGFHEGRADHKAERGGHEIFGRSGGGNGGLHSQLISSPMSPQMMPKQGRVAHAEETKP